MDCRWGRRIEPAPSRIRRTFSERFRSTPAPSPNTTPHFPILLKERASFPKIDIKVTIAANDEIFEKLIAGEIDFGFVTRKTDNPVVLHELFAQEQYTLVGNNRDLVRGINAQTLPEIPFISYPGMDVLLDFWKHVYFPQKNNFNAHSMLERGEINHLDGAITMVRHGLGCGVFPRHCVEEFIQSKELFPFTTQLKRDPVGDIYIVSRKNFVLPTRVKRVQDAFWKMKAG